MKAIESNIILTIHKHTINTNVADKVRIIKDYLSLYNCVANLNKSIIVKGLIVLDVRLKGVRI